MLFNSLNSQWLNFNRNALGLFLGSRPRWRWPASIPSSSIRSCFQSQTSWLPPWRWCAITSHPKKITKTISARSSKLYTLKRAQNSWTPKMDLKKTMPKGDYFFCFLLAPGFWAIAKQYCGRVQSGENQLGYRNEILHKFQAVWSGSTPEISEKSWTIKYAMKEVTTSHFCYHYPCQNPKVNPGVNPKKGLPINAMTLFTIKTQHCFLSGLLCQRSMSWLCEKAQGEGQGKGLVQRPESIPPAQERNHQMVRFSWIFHFHILLVDSKVSILSQKHWLSGYKIN